MSTLLEIENGQLLKNRDLVTMLSSVRQNVSSNGPYYQLTFQDNSGIVEGVMWKIPSHLQDLVERCEKEEGLYVAVTGKVGQYKNKIQINADNLEILSSEDVNPLQFLPVVPQDRTELWAKVKELIAQVQDEDYKQLLLAFFNHEEWRNGYVSGVGGLKMHHNYIGGLMEHSIQVTSTALFAADGAFMFPNLNRSLIITGGLLHDIGKIKEYLYSKSIAYNQNGIEHRYEGISMLDVLIDRHNLSIDPVKLKQLKNIIMSHHGTWGDPNVKMETPEAVVIHHADCISAHVNGFKGGR